MTTTTERRAGNEYEVGQRYLVSDGNTREVTLSGVMPNGCGSGCVTHARWKEPHGGMNGGCLTSDGRGFVGVYMKRIDVPAAAPLAADRTKCKAWCGMRQDISREYDRMAGEGYSDNVPGERALWWCSPKCRDARLPPLAAQPAETPRCARPLPNGHLCALNLNHLNACSMWRVEAAQPAETKCGVIGCVNGSCMWCVRKASKPAPQPAPAKVEQPGLVVAAPCDDCGETDDVEWFQFDNMTRVYCQPCRIGATVWMAAQTGTPYTGPERLERSKLAHSYGVECPTLEDC